MTLKVRNIINPPQFTPRIVKRKLWDIKKFSVRNKGMTFIVLSNNQNDYVLICLLVCLIMWV